MKTESNNTEWVGRIKERLDNIQDCVKTLTNRIDNEFVERFDYEREVERINGEIKDIKKDLRDLNQLPQKVERNGENINNLMSIPTKIAWFVFSAIATGLLALIINVK